jgi:hypothetical protein
MSEANNFASNLQSAIRSCFMYIKDLFCIRQWVLCVLRRSMNTMKLGLVGLPQVGKKTLFSLLTGQTASDIGQAKVRDVRFDILMEMHKPEREVPAQMEFVLLPDLDTDADRNADVFKGLELGDLFACADI